MNTENIQITPDTVQQGQSLTQEEALLQQKKNDYDMILATYGKGFVDIGLSDDRIISFAEFAANAISDSTFNVPGNLDTSYLYELANIGIPIQVPDSSIINITYYLRGLRYY